ncbi:MAG: TetR/AcrR family transcriptional regulator [Solirubrobacteraceae bacterium]
MPPPPSPRQGSGGRGARERILRAAEILFRKHGINATGVAELAAAAKVSKRTLYHHFPGKDDVVLAYLRECSDDRDSGPESVLSRSDLSPRARLLELFVLAESQSRPHRGSPFVNAAIEVADTRHPVHRLAADLERDFTERLAGIAREAGARDPEGVAIRLALLYNGAAAHAVVTDSTEGGRVAYAMAAAILNDAID